MNNLEGNALDFEGVITADGKEYELLENGEYKFVAKSYIREQFQGSEKMGPCTIVIVDLGIISPTTGEEIIIKDRLFLHSKAEWKLGAFFGGLGLKKKGEPLKMNWNLVPGSSGICKIGKKLYNGNEYNEVKGYIYKESANVTQAAQPTQPTQNFQQAQPQAQYHQSNNGGFTPGTF